MSKVYRESWLGFLSPALKIRPEIGQLADKFSGFRRNPSLAY